MLAESGIVIGGAHRLVHPFAHPWKDPDSAPAPFALLVIGAPCVRRGGRWVPALLAPLFRTLVDIDRAAPLEHFLGAVRLVRVDGPDRDHGVVTPYGFGIKTGVFVVRIPAEEGAEETRDRAFILVPHIPASGVSALLRFDGHFAVLESGAPEFLLHAFNRGHVFEYANHDMCHVTLLAWTGSSLGWFSCLAVRKILRVLRAWAQCDESHRAA